MPTWLKRGKDVEERAEADRQVRATVEAILGDIEKRGDAAVRELSLKFDKWERTDFRLSQSEIDACMSQLTEQDLRDIEFAQTQVRNFAKAQRATMTVTTDAASAMIGEYGSRLSMLEGFVGHAEQANVRVRRYGGRNIPYGSGATPPLERQD